MKILHIIPSLRKGGAESLVIDIARELNSKENIAVRLIILRNEIEYDIEDIKSIVLVIPSAVKLSLWRKNNYNIEELQAYIEDFKPDVIHSHLFEAEIVSRSSYYPSTKWFSHAHDNMVQLRNFSFNTITNKSQFTNYFEKIYLLKRYQINKGTHFIAISKDAENYLKKTVCRYNITLLNNAINYKRFYLDAKSKINSSKPL